MNKEKIKKLINEINNDQEGIHFSSLLDDLTDEFSYNIDDTINFLNICEEDDLEVISTCFENLVLVFLDSKFIDFINELINKYPVNSCIKTEVECAVKLYESHNKVNSYKVCKLVKKIYNSTNQDEINILKEELINELSQDINDTIEIIKSHNYTREIVFSKILESLNTKFNNELFKIELKKYCKEKYVCKEFVNAVKKLK